MSALLLQFTFKTTITPFEEGRRIKTHPCPPHCPHFAAQLLPDVGVVPEPVVVVVAPPPVPPFPPELLLSLLLMKVSAACPYTEP
jgi:hypothetical protein